MQQLIRLLHISGGGKGYVEHTSLSCGHTLAASNLVPKLCRMLATTYCKSSNFAMPPSSRIIPSSSTGWITTTSLVPLLVHLLVFRYCCGIPPLISVFYHLCLQLHLLPCRTGIFCQIPCLILRITQHHRPWCLDQINHFIRDS